MPALSLHKDQRHTKAGEFLYQLKIEASNACSSKSSPADAGEPYRETMKICYQWLKEYVKTEAPAQELLRALTMVGLAAMPM